MGSSCHMIWRTARASCIGSSHLKSGSVCQDFNKVEILQDKNGRVAIVCVVSDGAGSAERSNEGSEIACTAIASSASSWWQSSPTALPTDDALRDWVFEASAAITDLAEKNALHPRVFACTLI